MKKNWMKLRLHLCILAIGLGGSLLFHAQASAADKPLKLIVNDQSIASEVAPFQQNNLTYIPFRDIVGALGGELRYTSNPRSYYAEIRDSKFNYLIDSSMVHVMDNQGNEYTSKVILKKNRVFVPLRWVSENLGAKVAWDKSSLTITVTSPQSIDDTVNNTTEQQDDFLYVIPERKIDMNASFTSEQKSKIMYDMNTSATIEAEHYAVKDGQLYSHFLVWNQGKQPMSFVIDPGTQKIIQTYAKIKEPRPFYRIESCSRVEYDYVSPYVGAPAVNIPRFYDDQDCIDRNNAAKAEQDNWNRSNNGISEVGSDIVSIRAYVQGQDGSYSYKIDPGKRANFVIQAPASSSTFKLSGTYQMEGSATVTPYSMTYDLSKKELLDMGNFELIYTWQINGAAPPPQ